MTDLRQLNDTTTYEAALAYAARGWHVVPIRWLDEEGRCSCGDPYCTAPGKHPLVATGRGMAGATTDPAQIREWWSTWPQANVAVTCGRRSGIVVIDLDIDDVRDVDGYVELFGWASARGLKVPEVLVQETGSGGRHLVLRYPEDGLPIRNATGWLDHVDLKSDGGYVLVAPSRHVSGRVYRWLDRPDGLPVDEVPLADPVVYAALREARSRPGSGGTGDHPVYDYRTAVREGPKRGHRDHFFNARAFELRMSGMTLDAALEELRRSFDMCEQQPGDEFPWEQVVRKAKRVWDEVAEPDRVPDWQPERAGTAAGTAVTGEPVVLPYNDEGFARRILRVHGSEMVHTEEYGWLLWDGRRWARDRNKRIHEFAREALDFFAEQAARDPDEERREAALKWIHQAREVRKLRSGIEALFQLTGPHKGEASQFDQHPFVLNCANGIIDLRTGDLRPHDRSLKLMQMSEVEYDPDARDDRWERYLRDATRGDEELEAYLRRAAGYTLTGSIAEEVFFILYGPKRSGKSTFIAALEAVLGAREDWHYGMSTDPSTLMHRKSGAVPQHELARMRGKRLVSSVEPSQGDRFHEGVMKQIVGGDSITGRHLYQDAFSYLPTFKLWIAANAAPRTSDDAMFRRIKRVPFPVSVPEDRVDRTLKSYLRDPASPGARAVLAWAARGAREWLEHGLGTAQVVEEDTRRYHEEQDLLGMFVDEALELREAQTFDEAPSLQQVFDVYRAWAEAAGMHGMTKLGLRNMLITEGDRFGLRYVRQGRHSRVVGCTPRNLIDVLTGA